MRRLCCRRKPLGRESEARQEELLQLRLEIGLVSSKFKHAHEKAAAAAVPCSFFSSLLQRQRRRLGRTESLIHSARDGESGN